MSMPNREVNNFSSQMATEAVKQSNEQEKHQTPSYSNKYLDFLKRQRNKNLKIQLTRLLVLVGVLVLWELSAVFQWADPMLTSRPSQIVSSFVEMVTTGTIFQHLWITSLETVIGFVLSMTLGIIIAIGFWWSSFWSNVMEPYVVVLNALPKVALGPIFYIWLGDRLSIYGMAIAISIIVTIIMIESGFKEITKSKMKLMESLGATRWQMLKMVLLPASIPNFVATMKVNVGLTLVGVIMGEFLSSKAGLGYLIIYGGQVFQMDLVMTSIVLLAVLSAILYGMVNLIGKFLKKQYQFD
ncbi:ABC transporter permease [Aquibacillus albus]|uniref:NitT/TauT family transport system permease protein n=1 Tax=Aquibacillus albus TaxID=1168171 RepID=A0ABS2N686_9BACI|nr:ABC transporter permease [Aquibacillus albus]MBM7573405.1 NitT/TauT family transport system permease protein [Aquibacillus albus]